MKVIISILTILFLLQFSSAQLIYDNPNIPHIPFISSVTGGNSSFNQSLADLSYWRLDGTNAPPTSNWNMGGKGFTKIGDSQFNNDTKLYFGDSLQSWLQTNTGSSNMEFTVGDFIGGTGYKLIMQTLNPTISGQTGGTVQILAGGYGFVGGLTGNGGDLNLFSGSAKGVGNKAGDAYLYAGNGNAGATAGKVYISSDNEVRVTYSGVGTPDFNVTLPRSNFLNNVTVGNILLVRNKKVCLNDSTDCFNYTIGANSYTDSVVSANNASWTSTYNATYAQWAYNQTYSGSTFNSTYNNILNQQCPSGQAVNGTLSNGTFTCVTASASANFTNVAFLNNTQTFTAVNTFNKNTEFYNLTNMHIHEIINVSYINFTSPVAGYDYVKGAIQYSPDGNTYISMIPFTGDLNTKMFVSRQNFYGSSTNDLYFQLISADWGILDCYTASGCLIGSQLDIPVAFARGNIERFRIDSNGDLNASYNLYVKQNAKVNGNLTVTGNTSIGNNLGVGGNITGNFIYGEMAFHNDTVQNVTVTTTGSYVNITAFNSQGQQFRKSNGVVNQTNALKPTIAGTYRASYVLSVSGVAAHTYNIPIVVNGVEQLNCESHFNTGVSLVTVSANCFITVSANDLVYLMVKDENVGTNTLTITGATFNMERIGT